MNHPLRIIFLISVVLFTRVNSYVLCADDTNQEVGIFERLGETIPSGLTFYDENGQPVSLNTLIAKPTIFNFVYFRCPGICSPLMNGLSKAIDQTDIIAGKDFNIVTISFDPTENYITGSEKKLNYLNNMKKKIPAESWRFLTGDSVNIKKITNALGFKYLPQGNDFMHGAAIIIVSKEGKIIRYLYGTDFLPLDLKLAIAEAEEGRIGPTINKLLKMCYSYDPEGRKYVLSVTRITGSGILLLVTIFLMFLIIKKKKNIPHQEHTYERKLRND